jgi:hypothetical protein
MIRAMFCLAAQVGEDSRRRAREELGLFATRPQISLKLRNGPASNFTTS